MKARTEIGRTTLFPISTSKCWLTKLSSLGGRTVMLPASENVGFLKSETFISVFPTTFFVDARPFLLTIATEVLVVTH